MHQQTANDRKNVPQIERVEVECHAYEVRFLSVLCVVVDPRRYVTLREQHNCAQQIRNREYNEEELENFGFLNHHITEVSSDRPNQLAS